MQKNNNHQHEVEVLHSNNMASIVYCRSCNIIQIEFGNVVRSFSAENFISFAEMIKENGEEFLHYDNTYMRRPFIFTFPYSDAYCCFSKKEWMTFYQTIMEAMGLLSIKMYLEEEGLVR